MDLNGDGNIDLLGQSFSGHTNILYGNNDGSLNEAIVLKDKSGTDIRLDVYYDSEKRDYIYMRKAGVAIKGDFVKAHDWDNDGDLDLFISGKSGERGIQLRINEGTKTNPVFGTKNIKLVTAHFADALVDWDGDGLWDIVGGSESGGVYFYKNTGKLGTPKFGKAECIIEPIEIVDKVNSEMMGITNIAVVDYNNDGKLDVVIGTSAEVRPPKVKLTPEQQKEIQTLKKESRKLESKVSELFEKFKKEFKNEKSAWKAMEKDKEASKLLKQSNDVHYKLRSKTPRERSLHGYVLLKLRK